MDIAALSMNLNTAQVQQSAGLAILKKAMETSGNEAAALLKVMEQSVYNAPIG